MNTGQTRGASGSSGWTRAKNAKRSKAFDALEAVRGPHHVSAATPLPKAAAERSEAKEKCEPNPQDQMDLARRTGRFPQLVDPGSRVNGLLLTGLPGFRP